MAKSADAFRTISEVADWLELPTHVLRFWESKFTQVKPVKRAGGRRYYRPADMELLGGIKKLLHDDGMTIKGVQKILREQGVKHVAAMSPPMIGEGEPEQTEVIGANGKPIEIAEVATPDSDTVVPFHREPLPESRPEQPDPTDAPTSSDLPPGIEGRPAKDTSVFEDFAGTETGAETAPEPELLADPEPDPEPEVTQPPEDEPTGVDAPATPDTVPPMVDETVLDETDAPDSPPAEPEEASAPVAVQTANTEDTDSPDTVPAAPDASESAATPAPEATDDAEPDPQADPHPAPDAPLAPETAPDVAPEPSASLPSFLAQPRSHSEAPQEDLKTESEPEDTETEPAEPQSAQDQVSSPPAESPAEIETSPATDTDQGTEPDTETVPVSAEPSEPAPVPEPAAPKPLNVDVPDDPADDALPATPGVLHHLAKSPTLDEAEKTQLATLFAQLRAFEPN